ncbi:pyruvate, phosphate dikinase, chloroplastic [Artemisia annua]|uniref:Pyruvate, phosphate dikinase, chloroplastic n=1 Tax=Artemisia annua TaxID=35608 RepID=A0A2U1PAY1_ARTAN|nr:pyruvate, phosphate dikinase, chloroplastic [Artemisia annua]
MHVTLVVDFPPVRDRTTTYLAESARITLLTIWRRFDSLTRWETSTSLVCSQCSLLGYFILCSNYLETVVLSLQLAHKSATVRDDTLSNLRDVLSLLELLASNQIAKNPSTGENKLYGEFLINAQREDVIRMTQDIVTMKNYMPEAYKEVIENCEILERHYKDMMDGYHQCRWSYDFDLRVRKIANIFRDKGIPCDVVWMDVDHI